MNDQLVDGNDAIAVEVCRRSTVTQTAQLLAFQHVVAVSVVLPNDTSSKIFNIRA
jgi:hypothetical protein